MRLNGRDHGPRLGVIFERWLATVLASPFTSAGTSPRRMDSPNRDLLGPVETVDVVTVCLARESDRRQAHDIEMQLVLNQPAGA